MPSYIQQMFYFFGQEQFLIGHISSKALKYISLNTVQESEGSITLNQNDYVTTLQEIAINNINARHQSEDATDNGKLLSIGQPVEPWGNPNSSR